MHLPSAFHAESPNDTVEDWVTRLDQSRGFYTGTTGRPVPIKLFSMQDIIITLDNWQDNILRLEQDGI